MKKFRAGDFLFFYCKLQRTSKLAAVISKKVDKKAVARNAWRRGVYHLVGPELIENQSPLALVCLYKGASIPENTHDLSTAWSEFKTYAIKKEILKYES
jgi:ribonuclease P protein component